MKPNPAISIVVPCYNEEKNLAELLGAFSSRLERDDFELILVDNGSSDGTAAELARLLPLYPFARSVTVPENRGYGFGILSGLATARGRFVGWTHGDLQFDPAAVAVAAGLMERAGGGKIFAKGLRRGRPLTDRFFTGAMSVFESLLMAARLRDINGQPTLFHRSLMDHWDSPPHDFSLDLYAYVSAVKAGFKIIRFEADNLERKHGESAWNRGAGARLALASRTILSSIRMRAGLVSRK